MLLMHGEIQPQPVHAGCDARPDKVVHNRTGLLRSNGFLDYAEDYKGYIPLLHDLYSLLHSP